MEVKIRFPDLAILVEGDVLPEKLREVAASVWATGGPVITKPDETGEATSKLDVQAVKDLASLRRHIALDSTGRPPGPSPAGAPPIRLGPPFHPCLVCNYRKFYQSGRLWRRRRS
jgi:hypothetical protein